MVISNLANKIFDDVIDFYHIKDDLDQPINNPYSADSLEFLLYKKCWIDTVQWHLEDEIRNPDIDPIQALKWKRTIDKSNQDRTNLVEHIDDYFLELFKDTTPLADATVNTESPAWAIDRLSILALKIYHMRVEAERSENGVQQQEACKFKLAILLEQQKDLSKSIDELLSDIKNGNKYMKVYKQMKMYNDPKLNPVLYSPKK